MNKKILIGSITAVAVLIGISFNSVVGYKNINYDVIDSPLFKVRTNRAIGEESKVLNCNYANTGVILPFPNRDDKTQLSQEVVDSIRMMDDETFERFITFLINNARRDKRFHDINTDEIREAFNQIRDSNKPMPIFNVETENKFRTEGITCGCPITIGHGLKGLIQCFLLFVLIIILEFIDKLIPTLICL